MVCSPAMQIRGAQPADLGRLLEIDATIESATYLHLTRGGDGLAVSWSIEERPLRTPLIDPNRPGDEQQFSLRQVLTGIEEGVGLAAEHDDELCALAAAQVDAAASVLRVLDLRVDYDLRRQGIGSAMLYEIINQARQRSLRAVAATTLTNNLPAAQFLSKAGFDLAGMDTHLQSNHDLVKDAVSLFWYLALD